MRFVPYLERYFEDYAVGEVAEFGNYLVTEAEIVRFASAYDPQPFHTDPVAATASHFGGLVGSGWMTCAIVMRLFCDHFIPACSAMGSPGIDQLRWLRPVRPGDRLRARATIVDARRSRSKPDRGVITLLQEAINQDGETVVSYTGRAMFLCRHPQTAPTDSAR
ncbi:MAG: MaoC family dehydratase [Denitromonas halophila]|nr:MAG: MaoC family dehydratase [Denitromonas halophila]TVT70560.1 MAG: MaoC family dehydratase [Denitromonas halophila]TVT75682.1 MAG: MaoC family dehydratase [Denitromonas halophila]